jgi:hypothetical protein
MNQSTEQRTKIYHLLFRSSQHQKETETETAWRFYYEVDRIGLLLPISWSSIQTNFQQSRRSSYSSLSKTDTQRESPLQELFALPKEQEVIPRLWIKLPKVTVPKRKIDSVIDPWDVAITSPINFLPFECFLHHSPWLVAHFCLHS